jgi:LysR family transcriptional regulator for bpeEF and oprC
MQARVAPKGRLRVDIPSALASLFILPQLPTFLARYPELRLELGMGLRPVHLVEEYASAPLASNNRRFSADDTENR